MTHYDTQKNKCISDQIKLSINYTSSICSKIPAILLTKRHSKDKKITYLPVDFLYYIICGSLFVYNFHFFVNQIMLLSSVKKGKSFPYSWSVYISVC